jgi:hypothetical protein
VLPKLTALRRLNLNGAISLSALALGANTRLEFIDVSGCQRLLRLVRAWNERV